MSYFRSYFEKNNTIIKNSQTNTSKNPTTEIFYGSGFSKFIFKIDLRDLKNKVDNGELVIDSNTRHVLHMTNTIFGDEGLKGLNRSTTRDRTSSFDLILFKLTQYWDEGIGFDYQDESYDFVSGNKTYDERPSNWFYRTTMNTWTTNGIYDTNPIIVGSQHFDNGNENLEIDITEYVNGIIQSGITNHGLGIAFSVVYQDLQTDNDQSVAFFTKYTQTFYEPFLESYFEDRIDDNRSDFVTQIQQNLYLYVTEGGEYINLDELPLVDILDNRGLLVDGLENIETQLVKKGIYKVSFTLDSSSCADGKRFFIDSWKNLRIHGFSVDDVNQRFIPKPITNTLKIGLNSVENEKYAVQFYGIKMGEKITSGDIRKVSLNFKSIENPINKVLSDVSYKIYVLEGHTQVIVHDWTLVDKTNNENCFFLDTSYLIPREYFIEFRGKVNNELLHYKNSIKFEIVSTK